MVFSSVVFVLVFLPVVLLAHSGLWACSAVCRNAKAKLPGGPPAPSNPFALCNVFLLLASLFFYAWGEPYLVIVMILSAAANYSFGLLISAAGERESLRKGALIASLAFNLGLLGYYKYMNLFVDSGGIALINMLLPSSLEMPQIAKIALPLGISFYTFQGLSYVIDVYRRDAKATPDAFAFSCYLTMFPQLVAGPIVRYATIAEELRGRRLSFGRFSMGASRFIVGLAKKILIADTLARVADAAFGVPPGQLPALAAWAGAFAYTCQIYYDFSGYSDMAIGMGHMLGFTFLENFNYPYAAHSVRDFWRRWHISLSTWFRDYLFIPLGGSRRGTARTAANLVAVFALCGLWHGASWIFLAWGLYHGFFLAMERVFPDFTGRLPRFARHIYVAMVFVMGWVLFRADSFQHAWVYYKSLLGFYEGGVESNRVWLKLFAGDTYLAFIFGAIGAMPVIPWLKGRFEAVVSRSPVPAAFVLCACRALLLLALLLVCFMPLLGATFTPFIYFRF